MSISDDEVNQRSCFTDGTSSVLGNQGRRLFHIEYMNNKTGNLNKNGRECLNNLYKNNKNFRDEIINFVGDKAGLSNDQIIDKR